MSHGAGGEFVEGWLVAQLLGEGAYGEVRLLVHARTGAAVALKAVRSAGAEGEAAGAGAREAALHRALRHPHVVRCLGARAHGDTHYMFLEYAPGGELFDRIEPGQGMPAASARRYWRQLLLGLRYLHARGVAHRDIKPENLLLDANDELKISDFGMATLFRHGARERLLARVCGTAPYAAPEVLRAAARPYRAPPADLWAAAVVLRAMLTGELPWERAHEEDARYAAWARGDGGEGAWGAVRGAAAALLRRALHPEPARRATVDQLLLHAWTAPHHEGEADRAWRSQPAPPPAPASSPASPDLSVADMDALISHSQPAARADELLLAGTPLAHAHAPGGEDALARLARRMTRVWVAGGVEGALRAAAGALQAAGLPARRAHPRLLAVECEGGLRMRAWPVAVLGAPERTLLEFRRWRGCGMHFKRRFVDVREALRPLAPPHSPATPAASAAEAMDVV